MMSISIILGTTQTSCLFLLHSFLEFLFSGDLWTRLSHGLKFSVKYARHCFKCLAYYYLITFHNNLTHVLLLSPFYRWSDFRSEWLSNLPRTQKKEGIMSGRKPTRLLLTTVLPAVNELATPAGKLRPQVPSGKLSCRKIPSEVVKVECLPNILPQYQIRGFCLQSVSVLRQFMVYRGLFALQIMWVVILHSCLEANCWGFIYPMPLMGTFK